MRTTRPIRLLALAAAATILVGGCSSADEATSDSGLSSGGADFATEESGEDAAEAPVAAERDAMDEEGSTGGAGSDDGIVTFGGSGAAVTGRQLARTASVIIEVEDVEQGASRVAAAAQRAGGFVSDAEVRGGDFGYGRMTLRVPASRLDETVQDLADVGVRVVESSISTEDLTDQLTDLGARIRNLETLEGELQLLLADVRTNDPQASQLLQVFERLNQVRGEIERLEAQRSGAQDRVSLATVNVELVPTAIAPEEVEPEPDTTLGRAWETTKDAFGEIGDALIWLVVTILPVALAVLALPILVVWLLVSGMRRRRDERRAAAPAPAVPPSTPPAPPTEPLDRADVDS